MLGQLILAEAFKANWRNPEEYPSPDCDDRERIAWEFLRRNATYAEHVEQMVALDEAEFLRGVKRRSASVLDGLHCDPPANPAETVQDYTARTFDERTRRRGRIFKPWQTFQNRWSLQTPVPVDSPYDNNLVKFLTYLVRLKRFPPSAAKAMSQPLFRNEAAVRFRLDLSIVDQLAAASTLLNLAAEEYSREVEAANGTGTLRGSRDTLKLSDAHLLLRCYDAMRSPTALARNNGRNRRTHLLGEAAVLRLINAERAASSAAPLQRNAAVRMCETASDYVERKKYLLLLKIESAVPTDG